MALLGVFVLLSRYTLMEAVAWGKSTIFGRRPAHVAGDWQATPINSHTETQTVILGRKRSTRASMIILSAANNLVSPSRRPFDALRMSPRCRSVSRT